jgi:transglutaminase-like putative cysteine protease
VWQRFAIREGWTTVFLTGMVVFISVWSIQRADWASGLGVLNLITLFGLIMGVIVSKWRWGPSIVGHLLAVGVGIVVILFQMTEYLDDRLGGRRDKLSWLWERGASWVSTIWNGDQTEDLYLFVLFISILTFLLAYSSMWFVLKARWIWAALIFPGLLLFINLGYSLRVPTSYVFLYLLFSLLLLVRFSILERETFWRRLRIDYPSSLAWRGMWVATYLGLLVMTFGWAFPASARSDRAHDAWTQIDGPWRSVERQFNEWFSGLNGPGERGVGGFASFSDSFNLGGPLRLSDSPVVLVTGEPSSPYLAAHRYSVYTGSGWESEFAQPSEEELADGAAPVELPPQVELRPGESVPVAPDVVENRAATTYTVEVQRPRGSLVFSPETFESSDLGVNLVVPWRTFTNEPIDLAVDAPSGLPAELQPLVDLLKAANFTPPVPEPTATPDATEAAVDATATPEPTVTPSPTPPPPPAPESDEIRSERQSLAERGIVTDYDIDPTTYLATELRFSGEFPLYEDVEAVYAREGLSTGRSYEVNALESDATSEELRQVGWEYPADIAARYTQLPSTVTPRTQELAFAIKGDATNPYDTAERLETWLRTNITYQEDVDFPPEDQDVVDYVLFDSRVGYCEYYASAFIVMARSLGIPARMVTGFFPADRDRDAGGFLYRERNAHAWPEVYFEGHGWVPFEPTAARSEFNRDPASSDPAPNVGVIAPEAGGEGDFLPDDSQFLGPQREIGVGGGGAASAVTNDEVTRTEWAVRGGILALMGLTLLAAFLWLRGMRGLSPAEQLYAKLARGARWGGVPPEPSMTPNEYASMVATTVPGSRAPATFLADVYVRETYGNRPPAQTEMLRARQAWLKLRGLLLKHFFTRLRPWKSSQTNDTDRDW